jgi:hypothetical protein
MLLDVKTVLPMTVTASFRPRLKLAWPAGLMTGNLEWDEKQHAYYITEESKRFVGMIGSPAARDISVMPYQEEPRDVPVRLAIEPAADALKSHFIPIVITGSVEGRNKAKESYQRLLSSAQSLYDKNVSYYDRLQNETTSGRRSGSTKELQPTLFWGRGSLPGFAPRAIANDQALPGSLAATLSGLYWPLTLTVILALPEQRWNS